MSEAQSYDNWVDPDILEYYGGTVDPENAENERNFKEFFEIEWQSPRYDHLRQRWGKHVDSEDPIDRLYGKIALWSYIQLLKTQHRTTMTRRGAALVAYLNTPQDQGGPGPADPDEMSYIFPIK
jgi:hypothetical protein